MQVTGYHGTSRERAASILRNGFRSSENDYDWLGDGIYFWQDAPNRARNWAVSRFGAEGTVLRAEIDLVDCLDLLDSAWNDELRLAYASLVRMAASLGVQLPRQSAGAHRLDREVLNLFVGILADEGVRIGSVRAPFVEGAPLFVGSALLSGSHVQIAVRDVTRISGLAVEE